jgi:hypothetical protein
MPKSPDAEHELSQANEETLDALVEVVTTLEQRTTGHDH